MNLDTSWSQIIVDELVAGGVIIGGAVGLVAGVVVVGGVGYGAYKLGECMCSLSLFSNRNNTNSNPSNTQQPQVTDAIVARDIEMSKV